MAISVNLAQRFLGIFKFLSLSKLRAFERDAIVVLFFGLAGFMWLALSGFQPEQTWLFGYSNALSLHSKNIAGTFGNSVAGSLIFFGG